MAGSGRRDQIVGYQHATFSDIHWSDLVGGNRSHADTSSEAPQEQTATHWGPRRQPVHSRNGLAVDDTGPLWGSTTGNLWISENAGEE